MELVDTHCHLDEAAFLHEVGDVLTRAREAGVTRLVVIGTTAASSQAAVEFANANAGVYAAVGIHPNYVSQAAAGDWEEIERLGRCPKTVGIGETGLDQYWDYAPIDLQTEFFLRHLKLSADVQKPFIVHCRDAEAEVLDVLGATFAATGSLTGIMHSFCGSQAAADQCLEWGMHLSFSGMVTYKKNDDLRAIAAQVPADRILVETDAPYLAPIPHRSKRNEPAFVRYTLGCLADLRNVPREELAAMTTANAIRLFDLEEADRRFAGADNPAA